MFGKEILVRLGFYAHLLGEVVSTFAGEQDVLGVFHYEAGEADRVFYIFDKRYRSGFKVAAIHNSRVHFLLAFVSKDRAAPCIKKRKSSSEQTDASTASSELPPLSRIFQPALNAASSPPRYSASRAGVIWERRIVPAPP